VDHAVRRIVELCATTQDYPVRILYPSTNRIQQRFGYYLVVLNRLSTKPHQESVRLRRALHEVDMPMDILVVSEDRFEQLRKAPGLIYGEAANTGKVVYEAKQ